MAYGSMVGAAHDETMDRWNSIPFFGVHIFALAMAILYPPTVGDIALCVGMYYLRMFGITAGFHRYFAHRSFQTSRAFQFFLAFLGGTATQKGGLWWAANHRHHHRFSDEPEDVHSPIQRGFWWSHVGWVLCNKWDKTDYEAIPDMAKYPELRWLNEHHLVPPVMFATGLFGLGYLIGGSHLAMHMLVWGFFVSTVILWHGTFTINSLAHVFGRRPFKTTDDSRNSMTLALITMGEGWHNNHHFYPGSMSQGFYWWQIDTATYVVRAFEKIGLVWNVRKAPERVLAIGRGRMPAEAAAQEPEDPAEVAAAVSAAPLA